MTQRIFSSPADQAKLQLALYATPRPLLAGGAQPFTLRSGQAAKRPATTDRAAHDAEFANRVERALCCALGMPIPAHAQLAAQPAPQPKGEPLTLASVEASIRAHRATLKTLVEAYRRADAAGKGEARKAVWSAVNDARAFASEVVKDGADHADAPELMQAIGKLLTRCDHISIEIAI